MKLFIYIIYFLLFTSDSFADTIFLQNNEQIDGAIISEDDEKIILNTGIEEKTILKTKIKSVEIGIKSIPVCFSLLNIKNENCTLSLMSISDNKIYFISTADNNKTISYPIKNISYIRFTRSASNNNFISYLKTGMLIEIKLTNNLIAKGVITEINSDSLKIANENKFSANTSPTKKAIETKEFTNRDVKEFYEIAIKSIKYINPAIDKSKKFPYRGIIPGWQQLTNRNYSKLKSYSLLGLFLGIGWEMASEYSKAKTINHKNANAYTYIKPDESRLIAYYTPDTTSFQRHRSNFYALGGAMIMLYAFNFFDIYKTEYRSLNMSVSEERFDSVRQQTYSLKYTIHF